MTEDKMVGWHHQLDGHEFGQAPGVGDGQGVLGWGGGAAPMGTHWKQTTAGHTSMRAANAPYCTFTDS